MTVTAFLQNGDFMLYSFVVSSIPMNKHRATVNLKINPANQGEEGGREPTYYQDTFQFKHVRNLSVFLLGFSLSLLIPSLSLPLFLSLSLSLSLFSLTLS